EVGGGIARLRVAREAIHWHSDGDDSLTQRRRKGDTGRQGRRTLGMEIIPISIGINENYLRQGFNGDPLILHGDGGRD
ncbi:hypothetical protein PIB30_095680, partial [Stylosanthes scabra]|nr:hypothetical protein [Stylosanthes scabra]